MFKILFRIPMLLFFHLILFLHRFLTDVTPTTF